MHSRSIFVRMQVNGKYQNTTPSPTELTRLNRSPKPGTRDYVSDPYPNTKFGTNPSTSGFWTNDQSYFIPSFYTFLYKPDRSVDFHVWWLKDANLRKNIFFEVLYTGIAINLGVGYRWASIFIHVFHSSIDYTVVEARNKILRVAVKTSRHAAHMTTYIRFTFHACTHSDICGNASFL